MTFESVKYVKPTKLYILYTHCTYPTTFLIYSIDIINTDIALHALHNIFEYLNTNYCCKLLNMHINSLTNLFGTAVYYIFNRS